ncbi:MAG: glutathione S-transferase family protein [Cocleimonas sp.]|nr:glutathione S-transferase family protein [Cocleimonas sp.]
MPMLKLVSFKLCPFVQRSVILLKEKKIDFEISYIDLSNPPEWFLALSPMGKVPILEVDSTVLFESAIINEYLNEVNPPSLHPVDPLDKAQNRAWMEYTSTLYMSFFKLMMSKEKKEGEKVVLSMHQQLDVLEQIKGSDLWFNGNKFSMVDISAAPLFMRLVFLKQACGLDVLTGRPRLQAWSDNLLQRDSVKHSVVEDFSEIILNRMHGAGSFLVN